MAAKNGQKRNNGQFQKGNPGRPKGTKNKDSVEYVRSLQAEIRRRDALSEHGWLSELTNDQLLTLVRNRVPRESRDELDVGEGLEDLLLRRFGGKGADGTARNAGG